MHQPLSRADSFRTLQQGDPACAATRLPPSLGVWHARSKGRIRRKLPLDLAQQRTGKGVASRRRVRNSTSTSARRLPAELEQEVRSRPTQSEPDREALARNARLANIACRAVVDYWTQLVEHLNALNPVSAGRYVFDGRTALERLPAHSFRVLPKLRVSHTGEEHFEAVTLCWRVGTSDRLKLIKEFPAEIEKLKSRLSFGGINACESQSRDPVTGRHRGMQFEFVTELNASVSITPVHDSGIVRLTFLNLDAFERIEAELPAFAMRPTELDELARWICGRPNGLLKHAQNIARHEP